MSSLASFAATFVFRPDNSARLPTKTRRRVQALVFPVSSVCSDRDATPAPLLFIAKASPAPGIDRES